MFQDFQAALIAALQAQISAGKHLATVELVQGGHRKPPAQYKRVATVDWDNRVHLARKGSGWQPVAFFSVACYATHPMGEERADAALQTILMDWEDDKLVGILPFLMLLGGVRGASGRGYGFEIMDQMGRGSLSDPTKNIFRIGAYFVLRVWLKPITEDDIKPL